jgi:predicted DNA-binding protein (MmcQ/YjbR family)
VPKRSNPHAAALRAYALSFPGAFEDFPWGERVAKVGKKVFVFLGHDEDAQASASEAKQAHIGTPGEFGMNVKLPESAMEALHLPFAKPSAYGLGAKGWVSLTFGPGDDPPMELLQSFIEESYRAVAPKTLVKQYDAGVGAAPAPKKKGTKEPIKKASKKSKKTARRAKR